MFEITIALFGAMAVIVIAMIIFQQRGWFRQSDE
jgi:hypothetical protein